LSLKAPSNWVTNSGRNRRCFSNDMDVDIICENLSSFEVP
jgi:hypothetical protein